MSNILISSESRYPVARKKIKEAVSEFLTEQKIKTETEVSIAVIGDRKMRSLNKQYRQHDNTTPVLTFSQVEDLYREHPFEANFIVPSDDILRIGDIVISYPQARELAQDENKLVDEKIKDLVKHGLANLFGLNQSN